MRQLDAAPSVDQNCLRGVESHVLICRVEELDEPKLLPCVEADVGELPEPLALGGLRLPDGLLRGHGLRLLVERLVRICVLAHCLGLRDKRALDL